jgi:hypothetical protein
MGADTNPALIRAMCYWRDHYRHAPCAAPWFEVSPSELCFNVSLMDDPSIPTRTDCTLPSHAWWQNTDEAHVRRVIRAAITRKPPFIIWLAAIQRQNAHVLPDWLLWHIALGVRHVRLYNNNLPSEAADSHLLARALRPFEQAKLVSVFQKQGPNRQMEVYLDALRAAQQLPVDQRPAFVGCIDVDEYVVPFVDGSLHALLSPCQRIEGCGGVKLNWRITNGHSTWPDHDLPMWKSPILLDIGTPDDHVKSFVAVRRKHVGYEVTNPHVIQTPHLYFRDDMENETRGPPKYRAMPWQTHAPAETQRAVLLHAHCTSLFQWVAKRTLISRADMATSKLQELCPTCNSSSFIPLVREYKSVCGSKEGIEKRAIGLYGDVRELRILSFLHELRANLSELVEHPRVGLLASVELALGGLG